MEKRTIIAIVLSLAVWLGWSYFYPKPNPSKQQIPQEKQAQTQPVQQAAAPPPVHDAAPSVIAPVQNARTEETVSVKTKNYQIVLSNKGASITSLKYGTRNIELVVNNDVHKIKGTLDFAINFNEPEVFTQGTLNSVLWNMRKVSSDKIVFTAQLKVNGSPVTVEKTYTFHQDDFYFDLTYRIVNQGYTPLTMQSGGVYVSAGDFLGPKMVDYTSQYNMIYSVYSKKDSLEKSSKGGSFFSKPDITVRQGGPIEWSGLMSRYFVVLMIPQGFQSNGVVYDSRETTGFRMGMSVPVEPIMAGKYIDRSFKVFVGEKNKAALVKVDPKIRSASDVNKWIEPIHDGVLWCLKKINNPIGNFGWSIIIFSFITKLFFLPLTIKSTNSMKGMQELTPKINALKEKYKDKPEQLQKETMKLYKDHKINPMSGCLPILVQMPFFIALYSALSTSLDLWQVPWLFWIKDLSIADTVFTIQGFNFNILPILMTGTTYVQQKMSTVDMGGQQKMMMMMMPLIFIVMFWNMPSGLILYWTVQNLLQIGHQYYINKRPAKAKKA